MVRLRPKIPTRWSSNLAYGVGLITADGCLYRDGRHINLTSKDSELVKNFKKCLNLKNKIGKKARGGEERSKKYFVIQFSNVGFYKFLLKIGLMPNKSKRLGKLNIPDKYFFNFLRGCFDGDGSFYSYWDPRWKASFMFYTEFVSASKKHTEWLRQKISSLLKIRGHLGQDGRKITYQLKYAKAESSKLLPKLYEGEDLFFLKRKYKKIKKCLPEIGRKAQVVELADTLS